jgi:hypothetical protein
VRPITWAALAYQGAGVACVSYLVWFWLMARYPVSRISAFTFLTRVFGVLAAALLLGEAVTPMIVLALLGVAAGLRLINARRSRIECGGPRGWSIPSHRGPSPSRTVGFVENRPLAVLALGIKELSLRIFQVTSKLRRSVGIILNFHCSSAARCFPRRLVGAGSVGNLSEHPQRLRCVLSRESCLVVMHQSVPSGATSSVKMIAALMSVQHRHSVRFAEAAAASSREKARSPASQVDAIGSKSSIGGDESMRSTPGTMPRSRELGSPHIPRTGSPSGLHPWRFRETRANRGRFRNRQWP